MQGPTDGSAWRSHRDHPISAMHTKTGGQEMSTSSELRTAQGERAVSMKSRQGGRVVRIAFTAAVAFVALIGAGATAGGASPDHASHGHEERAVPRPPRPEPITVTSLALPP